jgi:ribosomal-protein-alanine N-acetyltransferase
MLQLNFNPFPVLSTQRLELGRIQHKDIHELFELRTNPNVMRFIDREMPLALAEMTELINKIDEGIQTNTAIGWGIYLKGETKLIGHIGFHRISLDHHRAEVGYTLFPQYWQKGIISEALQEVLNYGFNIMNAHSIEANINPSNIASKKTLEKAGFVQEAYFRENHYFKGAYLDTAIYSLLRK